MRGKEPLESSSDAFPLEVVGALLEPAGAPDVTDRGLEPFFTGHALMVMAIFQAKTHLTAHQIWRWICSNFHGRLYKNPAHILHIDRIAENRNDLFFPCVVNGLTHWNIRPELEHALHRFKFDTLEHIDHHTRQLGYQRDTVPSKDPENIATNSDEALLLPSRPKHDNESTLGERRDQTGAKPSKKVKRVGPMLDVQPDSMKAADGENGGESSKPKRVRAGCLTCRERHLKCDEALPHCQNCRKSNRECKRGIKLNFIDTWCERPPHIVTLHGTKDWKVEFLDESREIADEYTALPGKASDSVPELEDYSTPEHHELTRTPTPSNNDSDGKWINERYPKKAAEEQAEQAEQSQKLVAFEDGVHGMRRLLAAAWSPHGTFNTDPLNNRSLALVESNAGSLKSETKLPRLAHQQERRPSSHGFRSSKKSTASRNTSGSIRITIGNTSLRTPDATLEPRQTKDVEAFIVHSGFSRREKSYHDGSQRAQISLGSSEGNDTSNAQLLPSANVTASEVFRSDSIACTVLELLLEPQWASLPKGNALEQAFTEKALIVMAFEHTELQNTTKNWKPATRRISVQNMMQIYHRLPARFRRRIASAYRAAAEDLYSSKATHVHLSFHFVHKRAKDPTHNLHQGWRVAGDFHLGRDSISPTFALAMSVPVEQHLMKVSKTMIYINRNSTFAHWYHKNSEGIERRSAREHGTEEIQRLHFFKPGRGRNRTEDVHAALRFETALLDSTRRIEEGRAMARLTGLAFVYMPLTLSSACFGMQVIELDSRIWVLATLTLCLGVFTYTARNLLQSGLLRVLSRRAQESPLLSGHSPTIQSGSTAQIMNLRRLSGSVLSTLTGATRYYLEAPVPLGMKRIRWKCRCGKLIYDDYLERKFNTPKSPAVVAREFTGAQLKRPRVTDRTYGNENPRTDAPSKDPIVSGVDSSSRQHGQGYGGSQSSRGSANSIGSIWTSLGDMLKGFQKSGPTLPQHDGKNGVVKSTKVVAPPKPDHLEYLLLCIPFKSHANKLMNIDTTTPPPSDKAFYSLLRQTYVKNRGRFRNLFSIRALSEIRFVQFEVFRNDLADVRKFDCIPPETQRDNYLYRPMPAEFEPPIGKNQMRHLYDHPDHADDLPVCYSRVPRKLRERLSAAPGIGRSEGWGICFVEGISWPRVCALGLAGVLASTIFGVVWTVVQGDIQGGFGVASYMLGVLVLGLGALQGAFEI